MKSNVLKIFKACNGKKVQCKAKGSRLQICVPQHLTCSGRYLCHGGEDEQGCGCKGEDVASNDKSHCYINEQKCNRVKDCDDGSDESGCGNHIVFNCYRYYQND